MFEESVTKTRALLEAFLLMLNVGVSSVTETSLADSSALARRRLPNYLCQVSSRLGR